VGCRAHTWAMLSALTDKIVYAAPVPTYTVGDFDGCLCYLPWNEAIKKPDPRKLPHPIGCTGRAGSAKVVQSPIIDKLDFNGSLPCLWIPGKRSANVMFYFHANGEDLGVVYAALVHLQKQLQVSVLAIEYPGYGLLKESAPSEDSICSAAMVALRYLVGEVGIKYEHIMILGRSLGSGPAVYLASRFPVGGLILVNPFASIRKAAESHVGKVLGNLAFKDCFDNMASIGNVSCPVLFIHAARDRTVPVEHSALLFQNCRSRKLLVMPEGMDHNSHLFADPHFLAVPAIHFFHFPCYQTDHPPQLPQEVFKPPPKLSPRPEFRGCRSAMPWFCSGASGSGKDIPPDQPRGEASTDDMVVPSNAAMLGHVDVADKVRKKSPRTPDQYGEAQAANTPTVSIAAEDSSDNQQSSLAYI